MYVFVLLFNWPVLIVYYISQSRTSPSGFPRGSLSWSYTSLLSLLSGRWLAALKAEEKHGLIEEPLMLAVFMSVATRAAQTQYVCTVLEGSCS